MFLSVLLLLFTSIHLSSENVTLVFQHGEAGYFCIRIPTILITARGTFIAFADARMFNCNDNTQIDIVYKRSLDNGKTWSDLQILYRGNATNDNYTHVGNIAPVQLKYNQRILIPFCRNNLIIMQTYSDDDGLTFTHPEVIYNITKPNWVWVALGPPAGLLLQSNRILIPGDYSISGGYFTSSFVMLNDHNGQIDKWYLGGEISLDGYYPNECQAVELLPKNNSIFINSRSYTTVRIGAYSSDGGLTFNKINVLNTLVQPLRGCEGSTIYHPKTGQLFYSGVAETTERSNLSLYVSKDQGENWTYIKSIWEGPSSYSSLTTLNDGSIGVLYEAGNMTFHDFMLFTIIYNETERTKLFE